MAGSHDALLDLLRPFVEEANLQRIADVLYYQQYRVPTLLALSDSQIEKISENALSQESPGARWSFVAAVQALRRNPTDGPCAEAPPSKKARQSHHKNGSELVDPSVPPVLDPAEVVAATAEHFYFAELLKPPVITPVSVDDLKEFLSQTPVKLPVASLKIYQQVRAPDLVVFDQSEACRPLTICTDYLLGGTDSGSAALNEATSSAQLFAFTGQFLRRLNEFAPADRTLQKLFCVLDSAYPRSTKTYSKPCNSWWENRFNQSDDGDAILENKSKLKVWSPLYYGSLRYVIGGFCAGMQFGWLKLSRNSDEFRVEAISDTYDLTDRRGVVQFLHSNIRMHCLLQKLQKELGHSRRVMLYETRERPGDVRVSFFPHVVQKEIPDVDEKTRLQLESLYKSIAGSRYLIQGELGPTCRGRTRQRVVLYLKPVGDPHAEPEDFSELENATHDLLRGLADLHKAGFTHRDLRWENCIKVNVKDDWKLVIIDLEAAGYDKEIWHAPQLTNWDTETLEGQGKRQKYTKGSDMYQLGKLISKWLIDNSGIGDEDRRQVMVSRAKQTEERTAAGKILEGICNEGCERCRKFDRNM